MLTNNTREMLAGTIEFLDVQVVADSDLIDQPVRISIDGGATWLDATWTGPAGTSRTASVLLGGDNPLPAVGVYQIHIQITDDPEVPIIRAGYLKVQSS